MTAIGGLSGYYLTEEKYSLAAETAHVLRTFSHARYGFRRGQSAYPPTRP